MPNRPDVIYQYTYDNPNDRDGIPSIIFYDYDECADLADGGLVWSRRVEYTPWQKVEA